MDVSSEKVFFSKFSNDSSFLALATSKGFKIICTETLQEKVNRSNFGEIRIIEFFDFSNLFAIVPRNQNKVIIWDEETNKITSELEINQNITNLRYSGEKLFILCENSIHVFSLKTNKIFDSFTIFSNPFGLFSISNETLAYPDKIMGSVCVRFYENNKINKILAHETSLIFIALSQDSKFLGTISEKGLEINVFDTLKGDLLVSCRRSKCKSSITHLAFSSDSLFMGCASAKGKIHIYSLHKIHSDSSLNSSVHHSKIPENKKPFFSFLGKVIPMNSLKLELFFAKIRFGNCVPYFSFGNHNNIIYALLVNPDGKIELFKGKFNSEKGGDVCDEKEVHEIFF